MNTIVFGVLQALTLALILVVTADAQTPPAFTERDRVAAIAALAGNVTAGTARDEFGGTSKTIQGFLTEDRSTIYVQLLAAAFRQAGGDVSRLPPLALPGEQFQRTLLEP